MSTETTVVEGTIEHPLEEVFDIATNTTEISYTEKNTELVAAEEYDDKDVEIEDQFQEVYDHALSAFEDLQSEVEVVEGKYKGRMMEVANQSLNIALAAAKEKSHTKQHKDKLQVAKGKLGSKTTNNTLIVADRNLLLKQFMENNDE